jgi:hypothetical protein
MDLVQDDQPSEVIRKVELRFAELGAIPLRLEVQVQSPDSFAHGQRQGGLAHLPGSNQDHGRDLFHLTGERWGNAPGYHPCNCYIAML